MDEVIALFNQRSVRYLLIGGQAVRLEGLPRFSMDWDIFIPPHDLDNLRRLNDLLGDELDMPVVDLGPKGENFIQTYPTRWGILQFHLGGPGLPPFDDAERVAVIHHTENGTSVRCLSGLHLLQTKRAACRPSDEEDIRFLELKYGAAK